MYIDRDYLERAYGARPIVALVRKGLEDPDDATAVTTAIETLIELAEAEVESALQIGGYDDAVPATRYGSVAAVPKVIKLACYGSWLELAHGRNGLELPQAFQAYTRKIEDIRTGKIEIPGVARNTVRAPGGMTSTDVSVDSPTGVPSMFSRDRMAGY